MKHTVLIVDDVAENLDILKGILIDFYSVKVAINGLMALKVAEKTIPDIILLDISMPNMDGYEVCEKLKLNPVTKDIPVIFVTAKDQVNDEIKGFEVGAVDYVTKPINPVTVRARIKTHLALVEQSLETRQEVMAQTKEINLAKKEIINSIERATDNIDNSTGLHMERMSQYMSIIAGAYGLNDQEVNFLKVAGPLHDVGEVAIPENILSKKGPLSEDEFEIVKTHCNIGESIFSNGDSEIVKYSRIVAKQHHEKWNGTGYPEGLSGDRIHLFARIAAVADVFDALTSVRPYKKAWAIDKAIDLIKSESGRHFDPKVIEAFLKVIDDITFIQTQYS